MHYKISLTPDQCESLWHWIEDSPDAAAVLLDTDGDELLVGQGDARCRIYPDGTLCDESQPDPVAGVLELDAELAATQQADRARR